MSRATTSRWTSLVPSQMLVIRASREIIASSDIFKNSRPQVMLNNGSKIDQQMPKLFLLCFQIADVVICRIGLDCNPLNNLQTITL